jgi:hypothetical protein
VEVIVQTDQDKHKILPNATENQVTNKALLACLEEYGLLHSLEESQTRHRSQRMMQWSIDTENKTNIQDKYGCQ